MLPKLRSKKITSLVRTVEINKFKIENKKRLILVTMGYIIKKVKIQHMWVPSMCPKIII